MNIIKLFVTSTLQQGRQAVVWVESQTDVLEHKWRASLKTILFLYLTSNTEATENKVQFFNLAYRVKGFQCHSNNSLQLLELKEKNNNKTIHVI